MLYNLIKACLLSCTSHHIADGLAQHPGVGKALEECGFLCFFRILSSLPFLENLQTVRRISMASVRYQRDRACRK